MYYYLRTFIAICSVAALVMLFFTTPVAADTAEDLEKFTGAHTRIVWLRGNEKTRDTYGRGAHEIVMGFDTRDGKGERVIAGGLSKKAITPMLLPKGNRVVFSEESLKKCYLVDFDGTNLRKFVNGYAIEVWLDPSTLEEWIYVQVADKEIRRYKADNPGEGELVWDRTAVRPHNWQVSADATVAASLFPWPSAGIAEMPNKKYTQLARGCWSSISPDNSYIFWVFNGSHRDVTMIDTKTSAKWKVDFNDIVGRGQQVYYPRWSNHVQYISVSGPFNAKNNPSPLTGEVYVGKFDKELKTIEKWIRLTDNNIGDYYPDVWIEGGEKVVANRSE